MRAFMLEFGHPHEGDYPRHGEWVLCLYARATIFCCYNQSSNGHLWFAEGRDYAFHNQPFVWFRLPPDWVKLCELDPSVYTPRSYRCTPNQGEQG